MVQKIKYKNYVTRAVLKMQIVNVTNFVPRKYHKL